MSGDDVHPNEMDETPDFDDATADALLAGDGSDAEPRLADLLGDMKVAYASTPPAMGAELAAFIGVPEPVVAPGPGRFERMRASMLAKCGAAVAVVIAGTSGLAAAGALPAPVQNAFSDVGIGAPHKSGGPKVETTAAADETSTTTTSIDDSSATTTVPETESTTPTTVADHPDNHGDDASTVAHDNSLEGCEHGHAVAAVASGDKSNGKPCTTTATTVPGASTPTTLGDGHDHGNGQNNKNESDDNGGDGENHGGGKNDDHHDNGKHIGGDTGSDHGNGGDD